MWVLKLKLPSEKQLMGKLAIKHHVSLTGYPLSHSLEQNYLSLTSAGFMFGEEKHKKALVRAVKKSKDVLDCEFNGDFCIIVTKQPLFTAPLYNPGIIRTRPVVIHRDGYHIWELAAFNRELLCDVLTFATEKLAGAVLKFKKEKLSNISLTYVLPEITVLQKKALELAINRGYYEFPKRCTLPDLATEFGVAYSTYQKHLKIAESKVLPELYKQL